MRHIWERWVPRVEDYWETFSSPYRQQITDLVDKATPSGGAVMDFGCGAGVQTFLLRQRRPDILIYAVDCNPQAWNLTRVLCGPDERIIVEQTPPNTESLHPVDTFVSIFTCAYLHPEEIDRLLPALDDAAETMILCEPTNIIGTDEIRAFQGIPSSGYFYPYPAWLTRLGRQVEMTVLDPHTALNAITVATRRKEAP